MNPKYLLVVFLLLVLVVPVSASPFGAFTNPTGNPLGGGTGYSDIKTTGDYIAENTAAFIANLSIATTGQTIYIPDDASINLTGYYGDTIRIPAGVTIASDRGYNGAAGGRIFQLRLPTDPDNYPLEKMSLLYVNGSNVRITGLRIEGPDKTTASTDDSGNSDTYCKIGILNNVYDGFVVDNCELYGWSNAAIRINSTNDTIASQGLLDTELGSSIANIHHNYIHHNQAIGLGYGVAVLRSVALVKGNVFNHNRHSVTSQGIPGSGYEATYNVEVDNVIDNYAAVFDVHGYPSTGLTAGTRYRIEHNTILHNKAINVVVFGNPELNSVIGYNSFQNCNNPGNCSARLPNALIQINGSSPAILTASGNFINGTFYSTGGIQDV